MPRKVRLGQLIEASWYELGGGEETEGKKAVCQGTGDRRCAT